MKINLNLGEEKWIDYKDDPETKFKIRPFPTSQGYVTSGDELELAQFLLKKFKYCIIDWQGLLDEENKSIPCTEENKQYIFDYCPEIMLWISLKINELNQDISELEKKT